MARRLEKMNQKELAAKAKVYQPQLSAYERCLIRPQRNVLERIAGALDIKSETLLDDERRTP